VRLWFPVSSNVQQLEPDDDTVPVAIGVAGRKIAEDPATYLAAFGPYGNPLGDVNGAVGLDFNANIVGANALIGTRRDRDQCAPDHQQQTAQD
jgi:hypothetical protein